MHNLKHLARPKYMISLLMLLLAIPAVAQSGISRQAYLQQGTSNGIVVAWRTEQPTDSKVWFGIQQGVLNQSAAVAGNRTEHRVRIAGLTANTRYYYAYGDASGILAGDDAEHFWVTSPLTGDAKPTRIWVLGDAGTSGDPDNKPPNPSNDPGLGQRNVRDAYFAYANGQHTDLWLMLGDNAYQDGTDSEYQAAVFDIYGDMLKKSVLWPTIGNHDGESANSGNQSGPYYDIFDLPTQGEAGGVASGTEAYYSFDYGNIHFISIDSHDSPREVNGPMMTWLQQDLAATTQEWVIVFWHHPPYSKGSHDSDDLMDSRGRLVEMRRNAVPILDQYGVDLVLSGHSHSYERSFLLHGHYQRSDSLTSAMVIDGGNGRSTGDGSYQKGGVSGSPMQGTVYAVAGCGGRLSDGAPLDHPVMVHASMEELGSMVIDIDGQVLRAQFLTDNGAVLDSFEIVHQTTTNIDEPSTAGILPEDIRLLPNYPNPFNPETVIPFEVSRGVGSVSVTLQIVDLLGRQVRTLTMHGRTAGRFEFRWDGSNQQGMPVSSGSYFYQVEYRHQGKVHWSQTRSMILAR